MGMESELKKELRNTKMRTAILSTIQFAGVITVAAMAPNVLSAIGKLSKPWTANNMRSTLRTLEEKGFVQRGPHGVSITAKGARYLQLSAAQLQKPRKWDRKWRIVIFDIPEKRRRLRNTLRDMLIRIGFLKLQNSVWVFPHDCEELIILLKVDYKVGKDVLYIIADKIENDRWIRNHFSLK